VCHIRIELRKTEASHV